LAIPVTDARVPNDGQAPQTSSTLLCRIQEQDAEAWKRFVDLYTPLVSRWCQAAGLQAADGEDIRQNVFQAVSRAVGSFHHDAERGSFRGWLKAITRNKIRDFRGRKPVGGDGVGGSDAQAVLNALPEAADDREDAAEETREEVLKMPGERFGSVA